LASIALDLGLLSILSFQDRHIQGPSFCFQLSISTRKLLVVSFCSV